MSHFTIYPAIDLKDGNCVRLLQGDMDKDTVFNNNPAQQAQSFEQAGFKYLHLVDLNGAVEGKPVNKQVVQDIIAAVNIPIQLGGGIRDYDTAKQWLDAGISRVILGTAAVKNPNLVVELCSDFPDQIVVGIDAKNGEVATEGWYEGSGIDAIELAKKFEGNGVAAIIYTDISRDGMMGGVNIQATVKLAEAINIPVIASGGVSCNKDIEQLIDTNIISGVITGRALYEGKIDVNHLSI